MISRRQRFLFLSIVAFAFAFSNSQAQEREEAPEQELLPTPVALPPSVGLYQQVALAPEWLRKQAPFARALAEMKLRAGNDGTFDVEQRVKAFEQSQREFMQTTAAAKTGGGSKSPLGDAWTNIGLITGNLLNGNYNYHVFGGGCVTAIAVDPSNHNIVYAGGTSGGVWKSTNQGSSWVSLTDLYIPNQSIASLAIDPHNSKVIYAGTGNGYASVDELVGTGLYKSTDAGGTWNRIGATGTTQLSGSVVKVLIDPNNSAIVFASLYSSNRGLYRSTDSGATWSKVYTANSTAVVWDVCPGAVIGSTTLFYFVEGNNIGSSQSECGIYKSVNEGSTWAKISSATLPPGGRIGRCAIAANKNGSRVFTLMANTAGDTICNSLNVTTCLFRSSDNGSSWTNIPIQSNLYRNPSNDPGGQGWYDLMVGVSPYSSSGNDTVIIGGVQAAVTFDGSNWTEFSGYNEGDFTSNPHVDNHCVVFDPHTSNTVYVGGDGGVYWSQQGGDYGTWSYRSSQMTTNRFYHLGNVPSDANSVYVGAQDQGTWRIVKGGTTQNTGLGGDGFQPLVNPTNTNIVYNELPLGQVYKSTSGIGSYNFWHVSIDASTTNDDANWDAPFKMAVASLGGTSYYNILYLGRAHLWRTTDGGSNWSAISGTFSGGNINAIGISQVDSRNIYVGTYGQIELTTDAGSTWNSKSTGLPASAVTSIVTSGRDTDFVLASFASTTGFRIARSTDKGTHWTGRNGSTGAALPTVPVHCVAVDSIDPLRIWYAATDNGIYYTIDSGLHWSVAGSGIGLAACRDVEIHPNKTTIRVATFGRGMWEGNTNVLPVELSSLTYKKSSVGTELLWHTDSEHGDAFFEVERSIDGTAFESIAQIPTLASGGNSNTRLDYSFFDSTHRAGTYLYQLKQVDIDGSVHFSNHVELHWGNDQMIVYQNYPNPLLLAGSASSGSSYNPFGNPSDLPPVEPALSTRISYELPDADQVSIKIYNSTGKLVRTLLDNASQEAGQQDAFWDGRGDDGSFVSSGAYFYVIESKQYGSFTNKMLLVSK